MEREECRLLMAKTPELYGATAENLGCLSYLVIAPELIVPAIVTREDKMIKGKFKELFRERPVATLYTTLLRRLGVFKELKD